MANSSLGVNPLLESMRAYSPTHIKATPLVDSASSSSFVRHPSALDKFHHIIEASMGKKIVMFLDYDGTLSPIVDDPDLPFMFGEKPYYSSSTTTTLSTLSTYKRLNLGIVQVSRVGSIEEIEQSSNSSVLEERKSNWVYSKPVLVLDMLWNFAFIGVGLVVLGLSVEERPVVSLRVWFVGYVVQCLFHMGCVIVEYKKRCKTRLMGLEGSGVWESGADLNLNSSSTFGFGSDGEDYEIEKPV